MKITDVELVRINIPLVSPFRTSFGTETERDVLLVKVVGTDSQGWGECVAGQRPLYSSEYVQGASDVISEFLVPLLAAQPEVTATDVAQILASIKGHRMAKAALEMAVLDAELSASGTSFAQYMGAVKDSVPAGVSVGIMGSISQLIEAVGGYLDQGYMRIKLKIEPGWDLSPVEAVRERFGDISLQVDANAAYTLQDAPLLKTLDAFDLLLIEQPLPEEDILGHARLASQIATPICLDESITSTKAAIDALDQGACSIINIKAGRVGGYLEAVRIHDLCLERKVPVWCGGMLETGIGRAANVALAALPGFVLPGDTSASDRYFRRDITEPFVLHEGHVTVPTGPGLGTEPIPDILAEMTTSVKRVPL